jgi:hypothetical protein
MMRNSSLYLLAATALAPLLCGCGCANNLTDREPQDMKKNNTFSFSYGQNASSSSSTSSSSTSSSSDGRQEISLTGENGHAELAGDRIEVKAGTVSVNGVSYGAVPKGAQVQYVVTPNARTLFVAGQPRNAKP